jgi:heptosyltransferase-3
MKNKVFEKILLLSTNSIGDCLLATSLSHSLRKAYPNAKIDVLVSHQAGRAVFLNNLDINEILILNKKPTKQEYWSFIKTNWKKYDLVVNERATDRTALYAFLAGKKRIGTVDSNNSGIFLKKLIYNKYVPESQQNVHRLTRNLRILEPLGIKKYPVVISHVDSSLDIHNELKLPKSYLVIHCPSSIELKQWPVIHWSNLVRMLIEAGYFIVLTGGPSEQEKTLVEEVIKDQQKNKLLNLSGKLDFPQLAAVIKNSQAFIGPDCGPGHLASSFGIPIFSIFGPIPISLWAPYPIKDKDDESNFKNRIAIQTISNVTVFQSERECVPCYKNDCDIKKGNYSVCLEDITPQNVFDTIQAQLKSN